MDLAVLKGFLAELAVVLKRINRVNTLTDSLGCVDGKIIGTGRSDYTQGSTIYNISVRDKSFALIDIPGIEGDESSFEEIIRQSLEHAHVIFYVNGSGKKIEKDSLEKIKKYMHDGTSVYAVFNVHCKAKKERIQGIDKEFVEELEDSYRKQEGVIRQTEEELISFLGRNYKGSISMNGLLGFCSLAFDENNKSSIKEEEDKNLRRNQEKYLNEYNSDRESMFRDSRFQNLKDVIEERNRNYESDIIEENLKKLKNRMGEMLSKITFLKTREVRKVNGFINIYNEFESNCLIAKEDFIQEMNHVASNAATDAFYDLMNELFDRIEKDEGKTKSKEIQDIVSMRKEEVVDNIQKGVNEKIWNAQEAFREAITDAQERMEKDFEREQIQFEISLSADSVSLDGAFETALNYNLKDFGKHAFTVGNLAISGAAVGTAFCPGLGTAIGAGVGAVLGVLSSIWNFFASEKSRINNAKAKIQSAIDEQIEEVTGQIDEELKNLAYEQKINDIYESLCKKIELQKNSMISIKQMINSVENELLAVYRDIA